jgi:Family of unknown function (DUF5518)
MIDQKSVIIGFLIALVLVLAMGLILPIGQFVAVLIGAIVAGYLANKKTKITVVEAALHGILVGIFTGIVQILVVFVRSGFSETVASILIIAALVLIGAYIIIGALGGIVGTLIGVKSTNSPEIKEDQPK